MRVATSARTGRVQGRKRWWREKYGGVLGQAVYEGLYFPVGGCYVLVTDAPHGLQVIPLRSMDETRSRVFVDDGDDSVYESELVTVPRVLLRVAREALEHHKKLQAYRQEFRRLIASSDTTHD
jgi:hypothetical protein